MQLHVRLFHGQSCSPAPPGQLPGLVARLDKPLAIASMQVRACPPYLALLCPVQPPSCLPPASSLLPQTSSDSKTALAPALILTMPLLSPCPGLCSVDPVPVHSLFTIHPTLPGGHYCFILIGQNIHALYQCLKSLTIYLSSRFHTPQLSPV